MLSWDAMAKTTQSVSSRKHRGIEDTGDSAVTVSVRLPEDLAGKLRDYQSYLRRTNPGVRITRSGAIRALVQRGLLDFERKQAKNPRKNRLRRKPTGPGTPW